MLRRLSTAGLFLIACAGWCSHGHAQVLPRIRYTRPCLKQGIPAGNYTTSERSRSVRLLSLPALASEPVDEKPETVVNAIEGVPTGEPTRGVTPLPPIAPVEELPAGPLRGAANASESIADLITTRTLRGLDQFTQFDPLRQRSLRRGEQTKVFTFKPDQAQIDHCRISELAVHLQSDGTWTVSMRAEQNSPDTTTANTQFLRQNQFVVTLRCLGERRFASYSVRNRPTVERRNATVVATLGPIEFFVKNGQPRTIVANNELDDSSFGIRSGELISVRDQGQATSIARRFAQIKQVELEFFYRGRSLQASAR